jgi:hypothetical protein
MKMEVPDRFALGDQAGFLIDVLPDLDALFSSSDPPVPFRSEPGWWRKQTAREKRIVLAVAYLEHPSASVRQRTIELMSSEQSRGLSQALVNRLCDESPGVQAAAAKCLWAWHGSDGCRFAALALRDEIRGYSELVPFTPSTAGLSIGRDDAVRGLDVLVQLAPSMEQRAELEAIIADQIIIEDRIANVDTRSIKFIGKEEKDSHTYEVYRAKNREQALAFLKGKTVTKDCYYIEVETPEGNVGRDVNGIYKIP